jgi:hypothetical protein
LLQGGKPQLAPSVLECEALPLVLLGKRHLKKYDQLRHEHTEHDLKPVDDPTRR